MIYYIRKNDQLILEIVSDSGTILKDCAMIRVFNQWLEAELTTFKARESVTKVMLGVRSKVPILINKQLMMLPFQSMRNKKALYINYHAIKAALKTKNNHVLLIFSAFDQIEVKQYSTWITQKKKAVRLIEYIKTELE